ncbi:DIS3-like exonuclease 2 [Acanthaster planci]|uniref:DIS3-like exonuclease 2 n=1 Tax=Acanthaster planci TaxID=133434 RepID=A0A8B7YFE0_ACAPL|nr:DIS3-like exonuclease 2 [Acanthaster planci]
MGDTAEANPTTTSTNDSRPPALDMPDMNCEAVMVMQTCMSDNIKESGSLQQEENNKAELVDEEGSGTGEDEEIMENEENRKKTKRKRRRRHRHRNSSKGSAASQPEVLDAFAGLLDESQYFSDEPAASQQEDPVPQQQTKRERPQSAKGRTQTQYLCGQQTGDREGRQKTGGRPPRDNQPTSSKGQGHEAQQMGPQNPGRTPKGKPTPHTPDNGPKQERPNSAKGRVQTQSPCRQQTGGGSLGEIQSVPSKRLGHKAEQKGPQNPVQTSKGKPTAQTLNNGPRRERPNSAKGRLNSHSSPPVQRETPQTPTDNKSKGFGSPSSSKRNKKQTESPRNQNFSHGKNRAEPQTPQNVPNGNVQTPTKAHLGGQSTPGSGVGGKKPKTPRSKKKNAAGTPTGKKDFKPFEDYLSPEEVSAGLKRKHLLQGTLRINPKNFEESYIDSEDGGADIMICGISARNRALEGDVVAVELLEKSTWKLLEEDYASHRRKQRQKAQLAAASKAETGIANTTTEAEKGLVDQFQTLDISERLGNQPSDGAIDRDAADTTTTAAKSGHDNAIFRVRGKPRPSAAPDTTSSVSDHTIVINNSSLQDPEPGCLGEEIDQVVKRLFPDSSDEDRAGEASSENKETEKGREEIPRKFFQKHGKVVYILERRHSRACSGILKPRSHSNATDALFSPTDHRMPRIYIPLAECPQGFLERPGDFRTTLFIARLEEWPKTSAIARGHLYRSLGEAGEIEPETEGMLIEHGVDYSDFSYEVIKCLPKSLPWTIPQEEIEQRRDFRPKCVFTIDPATARDLDDALSCEPLGDGLYEVGVHIADVSFFVDEGNALDEVAGLRATSVYLVQKVIPMLPRLLCEHLCSLNPNEDKLTFSFLWRLTEQGEILDEWCGRSVIRSCVKMSYDHAQGIIAEPERERGEEEMPPIANGFSISDVAQGVLRLNKIAQNLRQKRLDDGALRLDQVKLQFALDKESGLPSGYSVYERRDSNKLVEEFMLLANMAAAHRVHDYCKDTALLRRHPPPKAKMMDDLADTCSALGLEVDGSNSKTIQESLGRYLGPREDKRAWGMGQILTVLYSKPMQKAKYFCAGTLEDETLYRHYALNVPLYTHFTSPIRRYADILVHRQLAASLNIGPVSERTTRAIQDQAMICNKRKDAAKRVSDLSSDMFFAIFVRECGPLEEDAMVMQVMDRAFDVLVINLGVTKRVYCNALPLKSFKCQKQGKTGKLTITWEADEHHPIEQTQILELFSLVRVELKAGNEPLKFTATVKRPEVD